MFMSLCSHRCKEYSQQKAHHLAFSDELTYLTALSGNGCNGFLASPVSCCLNLFCNRRKLAAYHELSNVTLPLFTFNGPIPASKIALKCPQCSTNYGYSAYGNKLSNGVR